MGRFVIRVARELRTFVDRQVAPLGLTMQKAELEAKGFAGRGNEMLLAGLSPRERAELRRLLLHVSGNIRTLARGAP